MVCPLIIMLLNNCDVVRKPRVTGRGTEKPINNSNTFRNSIPIPQEQVKSIESAIQTGDLETFKTLLSALNNLEEGSYNGYTVVQLIALNCKDDLAIPFLKVVRDKVDIQKLDKTEYSLEYPKFVKLAKVYNPKQNGEHNFEKDEEYPLNIFVTKSNWKAAEFLLANGVSPLGSLTSVIKDKIVKIILEQDGKNAVSKINEIRDAAISMQSIIDTGIYKYNINSFWDLKWNGNAGFMENSDTDYLLLAIQQKKTDLFLHLLTLVSPGYIVLKEQDLISIYEYLEFKFYLLSNEKNKTDKTKKSLLEIAEQLYSGQKELKTIRNAIDKKYEEIKKIYK